MSEIKAGQVAYIKATGNAVFVLEVCKAGYHGCKTYPGFSRLCAIYRTYDYGNIPTESKCTVEELMPNPPVETKEETE